MGDRVLRKVRDGSPDRSDRRWTEDWLRKIIREELANSIRESNLEAFKRDALSGQPELPELSGRIPWEEIEFFRIGNVDYTPREVRVVFKHGYSEQGKA